MALAGPLARVGVAAAIEIPLLLSFLYLFGKAEPWGSPPPVSGVQAARPGESRAPRSALETVSGREFDWGGTSVKR